MRKKLAWRVATFRFGWWAARLQVLKTPLWIRKGFFALLVALATGIAQIALADGIVVQVVGTTTGASVGPQRAAVWQRSDSLELIIEPVFDWDVESPGAWVIPLPALPLEVRAGDPLFLDDLDLATAPRFEEACLEGYCCCPYWRCDAAAPEPRVIGEKDGVIVWSSGQVGALDYVILSSPEGSELAKWLEDNGFSLPEVLRPVVTSYETAGVYWFVAKVSKERGRSLMPVSFTFSSLVKPFYPVGLTLSAMGQGHSLEVHLFAITETGAPLVPSSHPWKTAEQVTGYNTWCPPGEIWTWEWGVTQDSYNEKITEYLTNSGGFVLEAYGLVHGSLAPESSFKSDAFRALLGTQARVSRLWGYLSASEKPVNDVSLENASEGTLSPEELVPVWCHVSGLCEPCPPCSPPEEDSDPGPPMGEDLAPPEIPEESIPLYEATSEVEDAIIVESHQRNGSGCNAGHQGWLSGLFLAILFPLLRLRRPS